MNRLAVGVIALAFLGSVGFAKGKKADATRTTNAAEVKTPTPPKNLKDVTKLETVDIKKGKGAVATAGKQVKVHYTGWLTNKTLFDSSVPRKTPFDFQLGAGMVIPGWDKGVEGMKVGGKRILHIPLDMGYGERGSPPVIPPNSTLHFEVELLGVG